jgi:hypothetical protein
MGELDQELILSGSLDQSILADDKQILNRIEEIILESVEKKNAYIALNACRSLIQISKISGTGLAKAIYLLNKNWNEYDAGEFDEVVYSYLGLHKQTVKCYLAVYKQLFVGNSVPLDVKELIQQHNIKVQVPIALALEQGYEISNDEWKKLAQAPDLNTASKILREDIKGKPPRKGSLQLWVDDLGSIWATFEGDRFFIGSLEVDSDEEAVQKAIERIKKGSGIL